jgi:hypothetical protein
MSDIIEAINLYDATIEIRNISKVYPRKIRHMKYRTPWTKQRPGLEKAPHYLEDAILTKNQKIMGQCPVVGDSSSNASIAYNDKTQKLIDEENLARSIRRTKTQLRDLVQCNDFDLFGTITFDKRKIDRQDVELCKKSVTRWIDNLQKKYSRFDYLLIPELHKDGALHFHALFKDYPGELTDSGHKDNSKRIVWHLSDYKKGFTNFSYIGSVERTATYIGKYITKDTPVIQGKKRYFASRGLKRPTRIYNDTLENADYDIENLVEIKNKPNFKIVDIPRHSALFHDA